MYNSVDLDKALNTTAAMFVVCQSYECVLTDFSQGSYKTAYPPMEEIKGSVFQPHKM